MSYQEDLDIFYDKINVEYATYVATTLANFGSNEELGFRTAGSQAETEASNFIFQEFINIGLQKNKLTLIPGILKMPLYIMSINYNLKKLH